MGRGHWGRAAGAPAVCAALASCAALAGCGGTRAASATATATTVTATSARVAADTHAAAPRARRRTSRPAGRAGGGTPVPAVIIHTGPDLAVYARVTIHGHPYLFRVDTGAARTVIYANVAQARGLADDGDAQEVQTVGCAITDQPVALSDWRLGSVALPATSVIAQRETSALAHEWIDGVHVGGLLGNDVLSRLHRLTVDYSGRRLIVGVTQLRAGHRIKLTVHDSPTDGIDLTVAATVHGRTANYLVDTGSSTPLLAPGEAARLGLRRTGPQRNLSGGAGCVDDATPVRVNDWSLGGLALPAITGASSADAFAVAQEGPDIAGLIGSDTLAGFGQATVEYGRGRLVLGGTLG